MTRLTFFTTVIAAVSVCFVMATVSAQETQPAATDQAQSPPQMPQGHPPLPQENQQLPQDPQQLPQGHPPLPQGHPPVAEQPAELKVYETTEVQPAWRIGMRHLIIRPMESQYHVTEVWAVVNPSDKSYIGAPVNLTAVETPEAADQTSDNTVVEVLPAAGHNAGRTTLVLPLPAKASHVQAGTGFDACCVRLEEGKLISTKPLLPGTTELRVSYLLAAEHGLFDLSLSAPAPMDHLMIFLPDDGSQVTAKGLTAGDPFTAGDKRFRMYVGKSIEKGADIGLTIRVEHSHEEESAALPVGAAPTAGTDQIKWIAGIGAGILLLAALIVMMKPSKKQAPTGAAE